VIELASTEKHRNSLIPSVGEPVALAGMPWFKAARVTLIGLLMAAPLAFGAVQAWAWATVTVVTVVIAVLWSLGCVRSGKAKIVWAPLLIPGLLLLALAGAQLAAGSSQDPIATREAIIKLTTDLLLFFLALQLYADVSTKTWRWTGVAISGYAFALALFSILQFFSSPGLVYWSIKPRWGGYIFGPYISHNNYAGLMEMLIPLCMATVVSLRERHSLKPFLLFAIIIALGSLLLSGSRGGVAAIAVEFAMFTAVALRSDGISRKRAGMMALALGILVAVGALFMWLDSGDVWNRWQAVGTSPEASLGARDKMLAGAMHMARSNLKLGVGLGAFETAYPKYQTFATDLVIDHAHNDYAEILAESGLLGFCLVLIALGIFVLQAFRQFAGRPNNPPAWFPVSAAVGCCGLAVHSFSDFNLHIPANAAWLSFCLAWTVIPNAIPNKQARLHL
jgi:O-antigen ligase